MAYRKHKIQHAGRGDHRLADRYITANPYLSRAALQHAYSEICLAPERKQWDVPFR